jgi:hypothetical protein
VASQNGFGGQSQLGLSLFSKPQAIFAGQTGFAGQSQTGLSSQSGFSSQSQNNQANQFQSQSDQSQSSQSLAGFGGQSQATFAGQSQSSFSTSDLVAQIVLALQPQVEEAVKLTIQVSPHRPPKESFFKNLEKST